MSCSRYGSCYIYAITVENKMLESVWNLFFSRWVWVLCGKPIDTTKKDTTASHLYLHFCEHLTVENFQRKPGTLNCSVSSMLSQEHLLQESIFLYIDSSNGKAILYRTNDNLSELAIYLYVFIYYIFSINCDVLYLGVRPLNFSAFSSDQMATWFLILIWNCRLVGIFIF